MARSLHQEASQYGFERKDFLQFVNILLTLTAQPSASADGVGMERPLHVSPSVPPELPLRGERVVIRPLDETRDREQLTAWLQDEAGRLFLLLLTDAQMLDVDQLIANPSHRIGIITLQNGEPIGCLAFLQVDETHRKAELRKLIGPPAYRNRGLGREATRLWIEYGLRTLGLHKIYLNTLSTNIRNIRLNEEVGFQVEGLLPDEVWIDGQFQDVLRMGLTDPQEEM